MGSSDTANPRRPDAGARGWISRQFPRWREDLSSILLIIAGTVVTTLLGLITTPGSLSGPVLWGTITVATALLAGLYLARSRAITKQKDLGTLYYVRYLDSAMADLHESQLRTVQGAYMDLRTVTWSYPPCDEVRPAAGTRPRMLDVSSGVAGCAHALEQMMANDTVDTRFTYAPNAVFPCGMALGYQTYFMGRTRFVEFRRSTPNQPPQWDLDASVRFVDADSPLAPTSRTPLTWPVRGWRTPAHPEWNAPVLLTWRAGGKQIDFPFETWGINAANVYELAGPKHIADQDSEAFNAFSAACARSLWEVSTRHPRSPIVLCGRIPKSAQLAVGWRLAQKIDRPGESRELWDPWRNLITVSVGG